MKPSKASTKSTRHWASNESPAIDAIMTSGLPELFAEIDSGRFGTTANNILMLEDLALALEAAMTGHEKMSYLLTKHKNPSNELPPLSNEEHRFAGLFSLQIFCHAVEQSLARIAEPPSVEGSLARAGLDDLAEDEPTSLVTRLALLLTAFVKREKSMPREEPLDSDRQACIVVQIFAILLRRAVHELSHRGRLGVLREIMANDRLVVGLQHWRGFVPLHDSQPGERPNLRNVQPGEIVGNNEYLDKAMRLARDVAGYDFEARRNPKRVNPVLFALGPPGCGKTLVAHAVGNYFLKYCAERDIAAKFSVIRRTDWASSYQNASAANLIRIFKELHEFKGVVGIYWADIDTALASRDQQGLRAEEKSNLSAAFNIFDGTLLPFDGKWFMLADANNLKMDDALKTRIAQNPLTVSGPESAEDYVRLLKDILLKDFSQKIMENEARWIDIGRCALEGGISGRGMEGVSRQVIDQIQNFEYPQSYYEASFEERVGILEKCAKTISTNIVLESVERYIRFEKEEEEKQASRRFKEAVREAVFGMNVQRELLEQNLNQQIADQ